MSSEASAPPVKAATSRRIASPISAALAAAPSPPSSASRRARPYSSPSAPVASVIPSVIRQRVSPGSSWCDAAA